MVRVEEEARPAARRRSHPGSRLVGIYKALHILYGDELADQWIGLPNRNAIFGGATPLAYMISGGLLALQTVRKLLDARRGGV